MMNSLIESKHAITLVLADNNKSDLILTTNKLRDMNNIIKLLTPFKIAGEKLSSENNVTISLIIPIFERLKSHLSTNSLGTPMIKSMKTCMLAKMETRYNSEQIKILTTCSLLDVRYKSSPYLVHGFPQFMKDVQKI